MKIIAYTYEADVHCVDCTAERNKRKPFALDFQETGNDENGIPCAAIDDEGNPVHPVFSTDEMEECCCGDCGDTLFEAYY